MPTIEGKIEDHIPPNCDYCKYSVNNPTRLYCCNCERFSQFKLNLVLWVKNFLSKEMWQYKGPVITIPITHRRFR